MQVHGIQDVHALHFRVIVDTPHTWMRLLSWFATDDSVKRGRMF
jgi:hypothetical protein